MRRDKNCEKEHSWGLHGRQSPNLESIGERRAKGNRETGVDPKEYTVQFSYAVVSNSLRSHEPQHARPPCPSSTPRVHPNPCPLSRWYHPTISSSVIPFSSGPQSLPASGSFQMRWIQLKMRLQCQMEKAMAPHSSTLAWKIPWMKEPGRLQSMGSQRVGQNWATSLTHSWLAIYKCHGNNKSKIYSRYTHKKRKNLRITQKKIIKSQRKRAKV